MEVSDNLSAVGDVVIVEPPNQATFCMAYRGRVIGVRPRPDQIVRVVIIQTHSGEMQRPVVKLVKLPVDTTAN